MKQTEPSGYRALRGETSYFKTLCADLINRFGDSIDSIAYTWMAYEISGSAALTATVFGVNTLVSVLLQPFTGALVTNWNKKATLVLTDLGRGALVALTAALYFFGLVQPWMLICVTALMSTLEAFHQPAATAVYPQILPREKFTQGMSLSASTQRVAEVVGLGLAGLILGTLGSAGALFIDAATFVASGAILATLRLRPHEKQPRETGPWQAFLADTRAGFAYVGSNSLILAICISACIINLIFVPLTALQAAYVDESLRLGPTALSVMGIAEMAGMAIGSLVFPKLAARFSRFSLFECGLLGATSLYLALAAITFLPSAAAKWVLLALILFILGILMAFPNVAVNVSFMESADEKYLARASGIMRSMCLAAMPLGSFAVAAFATSVPVTALVAGFGLFGIPVCLALLLVKPLRKM